MTDRQSLMPGRLATWFASGAHGGTVSAVANPEGGGLEVTVTLPSAAITPVVTGSASVPAAPVVS